MKFMTININHSINLTNRSCPIKFGERLNFAIEEKGVSKAWIAEKLGISKQALNYLLKHSITPKFVDEFAELLNLNPNWIESGIGEASVLTAQPNKITKIPVLTKDDILNNQEETYQNNATIDLSVKSPKNYIAYQLNNNSNFPPFIEGSILIFDKSKNPSHGDYVLFVLNNDVLVRQYLLDGKNICYKASNIEDKTYINLDLELIGVLLEARYLVC